MEIAMGMDMAMVTTRGTRRGSRGPRGPRGLVLLCAAVLLAGAASSGCSDDGQVPAADASTDSALDQGGDTAEDTGSDAGSDPDVGDVVDDPDAPDVGDPDAADQGGDAIADADPDAEDGGGDANVDATEDSDASADAVDDAPDTADLEPAFEITELFPIQNTANTLSYFVTWRTNRPSPTHLRVVCGEDIDQTYVSDERVTRHEVFVMGLLDGVPCTMTATAGVGERAVSESTEAVEPGPLPEHLPALTVDTIDRERMQPGWTLWPIVRVGATVPMTFVMTDDQGRYRWYVNRGLTTGVAPDVSPVEGGILHGGRRPATSAAIVSWEGTATWESEFTDNHHDIRVSPYAENRLLYLTRTTESCPNGYLEEAMANEVDITTNEVLWSWNLCEHFDPPEVYRNWSHMNAIVPVPGENAVLLSPRDLSSLVKVDRETDTIDWILGLHGDFEMGEDAQFLRQHAPVFLDANRLLIFDNGLAGTREYSRALEIELFFEEDGSPDRAEHVWDYADETLWAEGRSNAERLPNGNTVLTDAFLDGTRESLLREVTPDGTVVWDLRTPESWCTYRSHRVEPVMGYVRAVE
jgi:hypothetical protein